MADTALERTDILVIGAGAAGIVAALESAAAGAAVLLVSSTTPAGGSSDLAQGGIAAATSDDDDVALHLADTLRAGRGLCSIAAVEVLVREGPAWIDRLARLGVPFGDHTGLEGGHSRRRVHQVGGAATGHAITSALAARLGAEPRITLAAPEQVRALWTADGACLGAITDRRIIGARATILATGGYAALFERTSNPPGSRGEGIALAYAAGAELADLEFVQFHPTVLEGSGLLLSEALRGEGAYLLDERGERFTNELAPRDEVARAIFGRGSARLDLRHIDRHRFPALMATLAAAGYDPARDPIPVSPAAHYTMGGIRTGTSGETSVARLFAAGECACTGVHGANRLASNSLLECVVFGGRAAAAATALDAGPAAAPPATGAAVVQQVTPDLRRRVWRLAGVVRSPEGLAELAQEEHTLARLIAEAALLRAESRGGHFRWDHPAEDDAFAGHLALRAGHASRLVGWA